ncbi:MAG: metal-dependent hydrolase [Calditrichia bacterium]
MPKLTYLSHSAFLIQGQQGTVVIDPFLSGNPLAKLKPSDIKTDYVLLTHGHGDHVGDTIEIAKNNEATVVAPFELANWCSTKGTKVHHMHIGGAHHFPFGRLKYTIAHHGSSTPDGTYMGQPGGLLITMDGKTLYHAGDTALFLDMKLIGELNKLDLAILPIGDNFTMGIDDAVIAAGFLRAKMYVPMHFNTFEVIEVNPQKFIQKLEKQGHKGYVMEIGETIEY